MALLLLKSFCTSAGCISFHFQDQTPFSICLVPKKGSALHAGMCMWRCSALASLVLFNTLHKLNLYFCRKSLAQSVSAACENNRDLVHGISRSFCLSETHGFWKRHRRHNWVSGHRWEAVPKRRFWGWNFRLYLRLLFGWCGVQKGKYEALYFHAACAEAVWDQLGPAVVLCSNSCCRKNNV